MNDYKKIVCSSAVADYSSIIKDVFDRVEDGDTVERAARLSLPIYLISYITDQVIYPPLRDAVSWVPGRVVFLPVMVAVSLVCSGFLGQLVDWLVRALMGLLPRRAGVRSG